MILGDIDGVEFEKAHSSGCSTHSVRISDPFNDRFLGKKRRKSVMEGLEAPILDLNAPVTGVYKGQHRKGKKAELSVKTEYAGQ